MKTKRSLSALLAVLLIFALAAAAFAAEGNESGNEKADDAAFGSASDTVSEPLPTGGAPDEPELPALKDGLYDIAVDSDSSMFNIVSCALTVEDGEMTAAMTMGGTGYLYVYMGTAEEAAAADEADYIPFAEDETGAHVFTVPVEALDSDIALAAFSKKKETWYGRTLVFRSDSLPPDAFDGPTVTAESLGLADGEYTVEVTLSGGSGRAGVDSPALLTVEDGAATAVIVWSSSNYDYMKVDGARYDLVDAAGGSSFAIPVLGFDYDMPVLADTIAMSAPHEIEYGLRFDSASIQARP